MTEEHQIIVGDNLEVLRGMSADSVDLILCSPPYEDARTYNIGFSHKQDEWVQWCLPRVLECLRVCKGLTAWVVEGRTRSYSYSNAPARLSVACQAAGAIPRKPPIYHRVGIPGSGGPDWLRNDYEFVLCWTREAKRLAWSDNTAMGKPPKFAPGGAPSHRLANGRRCNLVHTKTMPDGTKKQQGYVAPALANPGNVIHCHGGGGQMGSKIAHENEAPYPESLAEFFIRSFCPPGGVVLDIFGGSGTTMAAAIKSGRRSISVDVRESQGELMKRRRDEAMKKLQPTEAA
jgi:hypothetical protein